MISTSHARPTHLLGMILKFVDNVRGLYHHPGDFVASETTSDFIATSKHQIKIGTQQVIYRAGAGGG